MSLQPKRGTYFNAVTIAAPHGALQYFQRAATGLTATPSNFSVNQLAIFNNTGVEVTITLEGPSFPSGFGNVIMGPGADLFIEHEVRSIFAFWTGGTGSLYVVAES